MMVIWMSIDTLEPAQYPAGVMLAKKGEMQDTTFLLPEGWGIRIVYDLRDPAVTAFKHLGWTHWAYLIPAPPEPFAS